MDHQPTAELLARCSEVVYARSSEGFAKWKSRLKLDLDEMSIQLVCVLDRDDVQGFVGIYYGHRITCIRGTDSKAEGLTNLFQRRFRDDRSIAKGVRLHSKFNADAITAMAWFGSRVDYCDGNFTDWFTGHSRGGAVAAIMAAKVDSEKRRTKFDLPGTYLVTHCAPKSGNLAFANYLKNHVPHVRWQRSGDIVPLLPLPPLFWHDVPSAFFDSGSVFRSIPSKLTRVIDWTTSVFGHFSGMANACRAMIGLHGMQDLRVLIEREEFELDGENLLEQLIK